MLGGLARRATFIEELRRARKGVILVDTGDLFYSRPPAQTPNAPKMGDLKAALYMKTYNLMGYDAFTPGELDFSFGLAPIVKMSKQANFPFLAANLVDTKSGKPVFKAYTIKEVQGVKIGLLGLISNRYPLGGPPAEKEKFHLADPIETAKKLVPGLRKRCQVIAVLGHLETDEQEMLAKAVPEIFFILSGHVPNYQLNPVRANNSQIFNAGSRGEHLGQVDFWVEGKNLYARYQLVALTTKYTDHSRAQELINQYKANLQDLLQASPQAGLRGGPGPVRPEPVAPSSALYVGAGACLPCHPLQHQSWLETAHARAYQTLSKQNKSSDPACLSCHTTGFGEVRKDPAVSLENVQCEACHGVGDGHPDPWKNLPQVNETQCLKCHNSANSPNFSFAAYLQKVRHSK